MKIVTSIICGGLLATCAAGWSGSAAEKLRVSGERSPQEAKENARFFREKLKNRRLGERRESGRPSLEGVTTSPFQLPRSPMSRILTKEELQRWQDKKNWIFQDPGEEPLSDANLYRALGIRGFEQTEDPENILTDSSASAMERYVTRQAEGERQGVGGMTEPPAAPVLNLSSRQNDSLAPISDPTQPTQDTPVLSLTGEEAGSVAARSAQLGLSRTPGDSLHPFGWIGSRATRSGKNGAAVSLLNTRDASQLSGVAGLLGHSPIESAIGSLNTSLQGTVTDPINAFPDQTRQEINPMTASGLGRSVAKPLFPDPRAAKEQVVQLRSTPRRSVIDTLPPRSRTYLPPVVGRGSSFDPNFSPSKSVRTHLEIPGRTF